MEKKEFQRLAVRTESIVDKIDVTVGDGTAFLAILRSFNAAGELLDMYKKHIFYGRPLNVELMKTEIATVTAYGEHARDCFVGAANPIDPLSRPGTLDMDPRIFHALLGTITEHAEIGQAMEKALMGREELDLVNVCEELGDSDWYKALFFEATGISWDDVQEMIIKKLEIRYGDKIFTDGEANKRDLEAERELLEASVKEAVEAYHGSNG